MTAPLNHWSDFDGNWSQWSPSDRDQNIYTLKGSDIPGSWGVGPNSAKSSNDLLWNHWSKFEGNWSQWSPSGWDPTSQGAEVQAKWGQIVLNLLTTSPLKPLVRFFMQIAYNNHLVVGIRIYSWKWSDITGSWGVGPNSAKSSKDLLWTTGQILMRLDHLLVGIIIYSWKGFDPTGGLRGGAKWGWIVQIFLTTSLKPLVRF